MRPRALLNLINQWWYAVARRRTLKAYAWCRAAVPSMFIPTGWGLITWSMFKWHPRAWAASVGMYLLLNAAADIYAARVASRAERDRLRIDR